MMQKIALPTLSESHPDHLMTCELALEPAFRALAAEAELAGWSAEVVAEALARLAEERHRQLVAAAILDSQMAKTG
jgi:hypothetical protein